MAGLRDQVIGLINEANLSDSPEEKLVQVQEIMLKRERSLLPEFIDNVLDFQVSRRITGRRFTAQFAEAVIKQRPQEFLTRCAECVLNLLSDESPGVLKYAIRAAGEAFRKVLHSLCVERSGVSPDTAKPQPSYERSPDTAPAVCRTAASSAVSSRRSEPEEARAATFERLGRRPEDRCGG